MARILLFGGSGMAGIAAHALLSASGHTLVVPDRTAFDIERDRPSALPLGEVDTVINLAGLTNKREGSAGERAFTQVNTIFPHVLAELCAVHGVRMIHLSTDCVFDGSVGGHDEDSPPLAGDLYGRTKALGEPAGALVLRTSIIGPEVRNHYNLMCWALRQEGRIPGYTNCLWNGITTLALARALDRIVSGGLHVNGVRHLFSDTVSKAELVGMIRRAFGKPVDIVPATLTPARDMRLATRHPQFRAALDLPSLAQQVAELADFADHVGHWRFPAAARD